MKIKRAQAIFLAGMVKIESENDTTLAVKLKTFGRKQLDPINEETEEKRIEVLTDHCMTYQEGDKKDGIIRGENNQLLFTRENEKAAKKLIKEIYEQEVEIDLAPLAKEVVDLIKEVIEPEVQEECVTKSTLKKS